MKQGSQKLGKIWKRTELGQTKNERDILIDCLLKHVTINSTLCIRIESRMEPMKLIRFGMTIKSENLGCSWDK